MSQIRSRLLAILSMLVVCSAIADEPKVPPVAPKQESEPAATVIQRIHGNLMRTRILLELERSELKKDILSFSERKLSADPSWRRKPFAVGIKVMKYETLEAGPDGKQIRPRVVIVKTGAIANSPDTLAADLEREKKEVKELKAKWNAACAELEAVEQRLPIVKRLEIEARELADGLESNPLGRIVLDVKYDDLVRRVKAQAGIASAMSPKQDLIREAKLLFSRWSATESWAKRELADSEMLVKSLREATLAAEERLPAAKSKADALALQLTSCNSQLEAIAKQFDRANQGLHAEFNGKPVELAALTKIRDESRRQFLKAREQWNDANSAVGELTRQISDQPKLAAGLVAWHATLPSFIAVAQKHAESTRTLLSLIEATPEAEFEANAADWKQRLSDIEDKLYEPVRSEK